MAKSKPIAQTVHIGRSNMEKLATKVIDKVFENTVFRSKDVKDKPFEKYSEGYKKVSQSSSGSPDLHLSGKMMRSLKWFNANEDSVLVGWKVDKSKKKLVWNESNRGKNRQISKNSGTFPFAPSVEKMFFEDVNKILNEKVKKTSSKTVFKINM